MTSPRADEAGAGRGDPQIDSPVRVWYSSDMQDGTSNFIKRLREDTARGFQLLRQSGSILADRALQETNILKDRYRVGRMERDLQERYCELGEKVFDRLQIGEEKLLAEEEAAAAFQQIDLILKERNRLLAEIEELKKGASGAAGGGT